MSGNATQDQNQLPPCLVRASASRGAIHRHPMEAVV